MQEEIYIVGAGTYGDVLYELAELLGYKVIGFFDEDDNKLNSTVMDVNVIGKFSELKNDEIKEKQFVVAIGNNIIRDKVMEKINAAGGSTPSLIHPTAIISPSAQIGKGVYIQANANIWTKVTINDYCYISPNVVVAHHSIIGRACLLSTLSAIGASLEVKDRVFVGMSATVITGVQTIGEDSIIGAGAVVLKNVEKYSVYAGVPAKKLRNV